MTRRRTAMPFLLVLCDDDHRRFSVVGPLVDDTSWNRRVCTAQELGRNVRCFTPDAAKTRDEVIESVQSEQRLEYTDQPIV
jgi:hypothetical protein